MKTLGEIASEALVLLERLKPNPLDAPLDVFTRLGVIASDLEGHGLKELAERVTVLMLAVAPVNDHATRPPKLGVFVTYLIQTVEDALKKFLS